jgi:RsiW-degrading membrane proteinase PrsW (M82 family)
MVLLAVAGGIGLMALAAPLEEWTLGRWGDVTLGRVALVAATHEEVLRIAAVGLLALLLPSQVNDPIDGLIYGSLVGLGMAIYESADRMLYLPPAVAMLPGSEPVRLLGHLVLGGIACAGIGPARHKLAGWPLWLFGGALGVTVWHAVWDWIAFTGTAGDRMQPWATAGAMILMVGGLGVYGACVAALSERSRVRFSPKEPRRLWGWPFARN